MSSQQEEENPTQRGKRVVLVTGASSGIGLATARLFVEREQAHVAAVDLHLSEALKELVFSVSQGACFTADVADFAEAMSIGQRVVEQLGRIDVLVNNAGISMDRPLSQMKEEEWDRVLAVDLKGSFNYIRAVMEIFKKQGQGKIVNVSSTTALRARRGLANYVSAKAGVLGLTHATARELGKYGVNVNAVVPGVVETPLSQKIPQAVKEKLKEETCLGRLAQPEDVARVIYFLASDDARHITGEAVRVDGGQLA